MNLTTGKRDVDHHSPIFATLLPPGDKPALSIVAKQILKRFCQAWLMGIYSHNFEMRRSYRSELEVWGLFRWQGRKSKNKTLISELSQDGCRLQPSVLLNPNNFIYLEIDSIPAFQARIVWSSDDGREYGCRFAVPLAQVVVDHIAGSCWDEKSDPIVADRHHPRSGCAAEIRV